MRSANMLDPLLEGLRAEGFSATAESAEAEPSAATIDAIAAAYRGKISIVIGLGGGSALDAAKAGAAMVPVEGGVADYLEGIGGLSHLGARLPWIACPSTAGTGSEATTNAVIRGSLPNGSTYKKSLRHSAFIPDAIVLDHDLPALAPREVAVPSALDALSQLLEAASSRKAAPLSDALAFEGIRLLGVRLDAIMSVKADEGTWRDVQYAAMFSGSALSQAGLGLVHGIAGNLGAVRRCPHGLVCGILLPEAFAVTAEALARAAGSGDRQAAIGLSRLARAGRALGAADSAMDEDEASRALIERLRGIARSAGLPRLSALGFTDAEIDSVARASSGRECFVTLGCADAHAVLKACL